MRKLLPLFTVICMPFISARAYVNTDTAMFSVLNKAAGKVQNISVPVNQTVEFEKLRFLVHACMQTDPFQPANSFAFVEISKTNGDLIFSNWMNHNEPGDNPLQNADYDVWLVQCE